MDYDSIQSNAYDIIAENGVAVDIKVSTMGTYSPSADTFATHATTFSTFAIVGDCSEKDWQDMVQVGDKQFTMSGIDLPRLDEMGEKRRYEINYRTQTWVPVNLKTVEPGGVVVLYKIQARR